MDTFFVTTYLTRSSTLRETQLSYRHAYPTCNTLIVKKIHHLLRYLSKSILHTLIEYHHNSIASANSLYPINFQRYLSRLSGHWIIYSQNNYNARNNSRELIFRDYSIISSRWIDLSRWKGWNIYEFKNNFHFSERKLFSFYSTKYRNWLPSKRPPPSNRDLSSFDAPRSVTYHHLLTSAQFSRIHVHVFTYSSALA